MMTEVTIWHLLMERPEQLRKKPQPTAVHLAEAEVPQYQFNRFLYQLVGEAWEWTDKNNWTIRAPRPITRPGVCGLIRQKPDQSADCSRA